MEDKKKPVSLQNFLKKEYGWIAQLVEQRTENPCVDGSIPPPATNKKTVVDL